MDKVERKKVKRTARKAAPKAWRPGGPRSMKKKIRRQASQRSANARWPLCAAGTRINADDTRPFTFGVHRRSSAALKPLPGSRRASFRTKSIDALIAASEEPERRRRTLGV
jgi:hypothetical protein